jgi:hypothetical protein
MTYWTMSYNGGTETALADFGIKTDFTLTRTNKGTATVTFSTDEIFDPSALQFAFKGQAVIFANRASADGTPGSFSGGQVIFVGYFDDPQRQAQGDRESVRYEVHNVWWLFERNHFKQTRNVFTGFDHNHQRVQTAQVAGGGSGYTVGTVVQVAGGGGPNPVCQVTVTAVDPANANAATIVQVSNNGGQFDNANLPATPNTPTLVSGTGSGMTLNLGFQPYPNTTPAVTSETFLGEAIDPTGFDFHCHDGVQILEIMNWMNMSYNFTRHPGLGPVDSSFDVLIPGTIEPHTYMPITRANTIFCAEAINMCLRWEPDAIIVEDPTTTISGKHVPTLHVLKLGHWNYAGVAPLAPPIFIDYNNPNIPVVSVTITTEQEQDIELASQNAKILSGVIIYYSSVNVIDNSLSQQLIVDKFGQASLALAPSDSNIDDWTPEASTHYVELAGEKLSHVRAAVTSEPVAGATSATALDRVQFWQKHDQTLNATLNPKLDPLSISADVATILDDNNVAIDTSVYKYVLTSTLPGWVPGALTPKRAHISAKLGYRQYVMEGTTRTLIPDDNATEHYHHFTATLTNIATGTFIAVSEFASAEVAPKGVAESAYRSLGSLRNGVGGLIPQYKGSVTFKGAECRLDITIGNRLSLTNPQSGHTYSALLIQQITHKPHFGETTVMFGTGTPIDVEQWIELARATKVRTVYNMPSGRADGQPSSDTQVSTGAYSSYWNIHHSTGGASRQGGQRQL